MRPQTMYRAESKKPKLTKAQKVDNHFARVKRQTEARKKAAATA